MDVLSAVVDASVPPEKSILLRYFPIFERLRLDLALDHDRLAACSIAEGARCLSLREHRGVEIVLCDETTRMTTGTYKDLDACVVSAVTTRAEIDSVVVSSGGNLGCSLARYGKHAGLRVFFFHPRSTFYKLQQSGFDWSGVQVVSVDLPERQVKLLASAFAKHFAITHVPDIRWRLAASAVRALFLLEQSERSDQRFDCIAQVMCAGYGPAGIYNCFSELSREGLLRRNRVPRFLGFQQSANAPMVRAWRAGDREIGPAHVRPEPEMRYLEPVLYNTDPGDNYTRLFDLMRYYGGDMADITEEDMVRYSDVVLEWLRDAGVELTRSPDTGDILEKTGLLTGVGIVKAIEEGRIRRGERVAYLLTGGARDITATTRLDDAVQVDESRSLDEWVVELGGRFGLKPPLHRRRTDKLFR